MDSCNYKKEGAIADAIGETAAGFSNKKKTGTIINALLLLGVKHGLNPEWIRTGEGERIKPADEKGGDYTEILKRYIIHLEEENAELKGELLRLTSGTHDRRKSGSG